ncbi:L-threonylcarbamoyladenylate synthase [Puniceibacterium confluentis]|uniref:L-threonylcarbamoyladenylate synthase n=1 Tax=Puniceibacterium confluentis TaxID=1958944 RepID=UPI003561F8A7
MTNTATEPADTGTQLVQAARCLESGGVVLVPTDTVLGLAALPSRPQAVARIFALKDRPAHKNLPVMVASVQQLEDIGADVSAAARALIASPFCPGPLSLVVAVRGQGQADWLRGREELAFRIPDDAFLLDLLRLVGPLMVTSANRSGMDTPGDTLSAAAQLTAEPDMVVSGRGGGPVPSTLVNCRAVPPVIERIGAIPAAALAGYLGT